jgi:ABC-type oligopeptide transport system substrate-binding subunit
LDAELVFTLAAPSADTDNAECAMRTMMGFPASYDAAACANYLINKYLAGSAFTAEAAKAMEGKTLAEIKADPALAAAWVDLLGWWQTEPNEELHFFLAKKTYPIASYEDVGILALSDTELVLILEAPLEGFYLKYSLGTDLGLVHLETYDACASVDSDGVYTNTYGTSVEKFKSFGPYKLTYFELDKQMILETNDQWYGYTDTDYAGQYQTTRVVYDHYENSDTAFTAFLQGKLDGKGLEAKNIATYTGSDRIYYTNVLVDALYQYNKQHPGEPLKDENGLLVTF